MRTTSAKSINLHNIRKLIEYSLKKFCVKATLTLIVFEKFMYEGSWVLWPAQLGTGSERVNYLQRYMGLQEMKVIMKDIFTSKVNSKVWPNNPIVKRHIATKYGTKSLTTVVTQTWNTLPENIRSEARYNKFEKHINTWCRPQCNCSYCRNYIK